MERTNLPPICNMASFDGKNYICCSIDGPDCEYYSFGPNECLCQKEEMYDAKAAERDECS